MKNFIQRHRSFAIALSLLFVVRGAIADQYLVPSGSMEPTIQIGDHIYVDKTAYDIRLPFTDVVIAETGQPARGDIIVLFHPVTGMRLVKRVVGVPGDEFEVDGKFVSVPKRKYFVMGDNRDNSSDSRVWGFVPRENIRARAHGVLFNVSFWPTPSADLSRIAKRF